MDPSKTNGKRVATATAAPPASKRLLLLPNNKGKERMSEEMHVMPSTHQPNQRQHQHQDGAGPSNAVDCDVAEPQGNNNNNYPLGNNKEEDVCIAELKEAIRNLPEENKTKDKATKFLKAPVACLVASLHDILGLSPQSCPSRLSSLNILDEVLKKCGKHSGEKDDQPWHERLLNLQAKGHTIMGLPPPDPDSLPSKGEIQTIFGEVLEVYTAKGMSGGHVQLVEVDEKLDDGIKWEVEKVFLSNWPATLSLGVEDCIPRAHPNHTSFLQLVEHRFSMKDPSTDVAVRLKSPAGQRVLLLIQNKATSNSEDHNIKADALTRFRERVGNFRDELGRSMDTGGVEKILGLLVTNAVEVDFGVEATVETVDHFLCNAGSPLYENLGSLETACKVYLSLIADGRPGADLGGGSQFRPRTYQQELLTVFEEAVLPAYRTLKLFRAGGGNDESSEEEVLQELQQRLRNRTKQAVEPPRNAEMPLELLVLSPPDGQGNRHFRAQTIAPCGAGKTVVAGMLANSLHRELFFNDNTWGSMLVVFVAPLITLSGQGARGMRHHLSTSYPEVDASACLCASAADGDELEEDGSRLVRKDPIEAAEWIRIRLRDGPRGHQNSRAVIIVGVTTNSLPVRHELRLQLFL